MQTLFIDRHSGRPGFPLPEQLPMSLYFTFIAGAEGSSAAIIDSAIAHICGLAEEADP